MLFRHRAGPHRTDHIGSNRFSWLWRSDPFPLFLSVCSIWAASQIWLWPGDFLGTCAAGSAVELPGDIRNWAVYCMFAAVLKLAGLLCLSLDHMPHTGRILIVIGLFMSIFWWTVIAGSLEIETPHSVTPVVFIGLAFGAAWKLASWRPDQEVTP